MHRAGRYKFIVESEIPRTTKEMKNTTTELKIHEKDSTAK